LSLVEPILEHLNGRIPVVVGPTAVGKTSFSMDLANQLNGEIISIDSRQIYKHFRIGTAQPTADQQSLVIHHLIDQIPSEQIISAGDYRDLAMAKVDALVSKGKQPVLAGGTFLYVSAICNGIIENDESLSTIREQIEERLVHEGPDILYAELQELDPEYCNIVHRNDLKRIQRAFEIFYQTGMIPSKAFSVQKELDESVRNRFMIICLERDREELYERIEIRVDQMINTGWQNEVQELLNSGVKKDDHAMQSVGYLQLVKVIKGDLLLDDAVEIIKQKTRQFAKRQLTWLRKMDIDYRVHLN